MNSLTIEVKCTTNKSDNRKIYPGFVRQYMLDNQDITYNEAKKSAKILYQQSKDNMSEKDKNMYIALNNSKYIKPAKKVKINNNCNQPKINSISNQRTELLKKALENTYNNNDIMMSENKRSELLKKALDNTYNSNYTGSNIVRF
jgi:hypothetical protein